MGECESMNNVSFCVSNSTNTASNSINYVLEGKYLIRMCPECKDGFHTWCKAKACKKQNPELRFTPKYIRHYYPYTWFLRLLF